MADVVRTNLPEAYFAVNLRADGPIPGICSMQILELTHVGQYRNGRIDSFPTAQRQRFQIEMRPLGRPFESATQSWLSSESLRLAVSGVPAGEAMVAASAWVRNISDGSVAVPVTWPGGIEGVHLIHYFTWRGDGSNPFNASKVANNTDLVNALLGEDRSLIAGIRTRGAAADAQPAPTSRLAALSGSTNLLTSLFR